MYTPLWEFCRHKYIVYTEGVSASGRLKFHLLCGSVLVSHPRQWDTPETLTMVEGKNVVTVQDDEWSDVEQVYRRLEDNSGLAEAIAAENRKYYQLLSADGISCYALELLKCYSEAMMYTPPELLVGLLAVLLGTLLLLRSPRKRLSPRFRFPMLGDTIQMAKRPSAFLFSRYKEFGPVFTLDLMGSIYYVIADLEAQRRYLYRTEGADAAIPIKAFKMLTEVPSPNSDRVNHPIWRKVTMAAVGPQALQTLFPPVLRVVQSHVDSWGALAAAHQQGEQQAQQGIQVPIYQSARRLGLALSVDVLAGVELPATVDRGQFKQQMEMWMDGLFGLPLAFPGSKFARALAAKDWLLARIMPAIREVHQEFTREWDAASGDMGTMAERMIRQLDRQAAESVAGGGGGDGQAAAEGGGSSASSRTGSADGSSLRAAGAGGCDVAGGGGAAQQQAKEKELLHTLGRLPQAGVLGFFAGKFTGLRESAFAVLQTAAAAADTTRVTLLSTLALVAMSLRVQEEIFAEQQRVIAEFGAELSYKAVSNMPYTEAVVKETLRLLPPAAGGMRVLTEPLQVGDVVTVPKGALILSYSNLMHCIDPALWDGNTAVDEPAHMDWRNNFEGAFRPERWLSEETRPKYYYAFGVGKHSCVGAQLVYMEVKIMLALLVRKFRMRLQTPDMLSRATWLPFLAPAAGTDTMILEAR
ncbi:hypothetical protein HYH02_010360 [Chlamydomonas schloesseri]|uniref:Glycosyl transferase CAP10 domain-containing protein n=1 Tax=Chlamydomonas schloesseri TaxID=2026947 RepID=A0A835TKW9_9CHLO|nr:hypothetical protein HYH02_010360 [Chlamydomonas schloesseri]|eukprot:KAG2440481.1 hypothetical protein HYH02_010360 [Chlamydomonas schloesseri]